MSSAAHRGQRIAPGTPQPAHVRGRTRSAERSASPPFTRPACPRSRGSGRAWRRLCGRRGPFSERVEGRRPGQRLRTAHQRHPGPAVQLPDRAAGIDERPTGRGRRDRLRLAGQTGRRHVRQPPAVDPDLVGARSGSRPRCPASSSRFPLSLHATSTTWDSDGATTRRSRSSTLPSSRPDDGAHVEAAAPRSVHHERRPDAVGRQPQDVGTTQARQRRRVHRLRRPARRHAHHVGAVAHAPTPPPGWTRTSARSASSRSAPARDHRHTARRRASRPTRRAGPPRGWTASPCADRPTPRRWRARRPRYPRDPGTAPRWSPCAGHRR